MKKIYLIASFLLGTASLNAADGDTTVISSHIQTHLETYQAYDTIAHFPDGTTSYRKITMEFELGKYACPGYNPSNPGEGTGQTGWCGDWDYDVHVLACTPGGDTVELGRLITPYANSNFPRTPLSWKHSYFFDVSDYYPLLKNDVTIRIFYAGWSGGFTGTVKFHFEEGMPVRNVLKIDPLWRGTYQYGNENAPISTLVTPKTLTIPAGTTEAEMKLMITGHGGDSVQNCAEFCKKWYKFVVNGNMVEQRDIWRDDCGSNFLYPQSGTWIFDRGNWCPGDLVHTTIHKIPAADLSGTSLTTSLEFQPYNLSNGAMYKIGAAMIYYGDYNYSTDAGIEQIISPNIEKTFYRYNPICGEPTITVKNYGSNAITSIELEYGIEGQNMSTYTWTNNLSSLNTAEITLPSQAAFNSITGTNNFVVNILKVNGVVDDNSFNNSKISSFTAAPKLVGGDFYIDFKMSGNFYGDINKTNWTISDMDGVVLFQRNGTVSGERYLDTVKLLNGCYRLDVDGSFLGVGLRFSNFFNPGYFRMYNLANGARIPLPKTDLGNPALEGNFGNGFTQYFTVINSTGIDKPNQENFTAIIYPNPAKDLIQIEILGELQSETYIQMTNIIGQVVYATTTKEKKIMVPTASFADGIYNIRFQNNGSTIIDKVVIRR